MSHTVYLGTKPVTGLEGLATHWAVAISRGEELVWLEIDGNSGAQQQTTVEGSVNTINGFDYGWWSKDEVLGWSLKDPNPTLSRGKQARSGAVVVKELGKTSKTDKEIKEFNASYLAKHQTYSIVSTNCQPLLPLVLLFLLILQLMTL